MRKRQSHNGTFGGMVGVLAAANGEAPSRDPFRRNGLLQAPIIFRFMWDPEVRPYLFLASFSFGFICLCHITANYFHMLEGLFLKDTTGEHGMHHDWDEYAPQVSTICKWLSSIGDKFCLEDLWFLHRKYRALICIGRTCLK